MVTAPAYRRAPRRARRGLPVFLVAAVVLTVLLTGVATPRWAAAQGDVHPAEIVPAVTAAYGGVGTMAVVVAEQQQRLDDMSIRAAEALSAQVLARTAGSELARRSEEHTSELQSRQYLVCRLLLEKKKNTKLI